MNSAVARDKAPSVGFGLLLFAAGVGECEGTLGWTIYVGAVALAVSLILIGERRSR